MLENIMLNNLFDKSNVVSRVLGYNYANSFRNNNNNIPKLNVLCVYVGLYCIW